MDVEILEWLRSEDLEMHFGVAKFRGCGKVFLSG